MMMFVRLYEVIHGWLGWCPNGHTMNTKNRGDAGFSIHANTPQVKNPGPLDADRVGTPPGGIYDHTQPGYLLAGSVGAACLIILGAMLLFGPELVAIIALCIMIAVLAIMSRLTVSLTPTTLRIRFGPVGLVRKEWPVAEIISVTPVTNPWYYGYGLRWTPHGRLYNVSGRGAVEVLLSSGETFRIGTDEPEALGAAIEKARDMTRTPSAGDRMHQ
jgi:hypothetical protein